VQQLVVPQYQDLVGNLDNPDLRDKHLQRSLDSTAIPFALASPITFVMRLSMVLAVYQ
jgi:hypothetical protein